MGVQLDGEDLLEMEPWERAREGVFLSFQYPQAVPGLQVGNFLRKSVAAIRGEDEAKGAEFRKTLKDAMTNLILIVHSWVDMSTMDSVAVRKNALKSYN